jgi:DNA-directed RNA polymerase subunit K/omega
MSTSASIITRDIDQLSEKSGNIYESINVVSIRARQIASIVKEELNGKLAEFASTVDNLEEIFENREQIEISKFYERMPKPTQLAIDEFLNDELNFREHSEEEESEI